MINPEFFSNKDALEKFQLKRLKGVTFTAAKAPTWQETETRLNRSTAPGQNQFQEIKVTRQLPDEIVRSLRDKAMFSFWLDLAYMGKAGEANKIIGRVWEPVVAEDKLAEIDRMIDNIPEKL